MRQPRSAIALLLVVGILTTGWLPAAGARRATVKPQGPRPVLGSGVDADHCDNVCNIRALPDPEEPTTSSTNLAKGAKVILSGVLGAMQTFSGIAAKIGGLGAGILAGLSGSDSQWETYKMEKYIKQSTDYLVCKMDAMVTDLNTAADKRMNDADLNSFNNGLQAIVNAFDERCAAMNCLNLTGLPPSRRSGYNLDCAVDMGASASCPKRGSFNPKKPQYCTFDLYGEKKTGLCDPTNGHCYDVYKYDTAVADMQAIVGLFASKDTVNNFNAFTNWWDTTATVALAKGALTKLLMLQQLIMLNGKDGDNGQLVQFADDMADKLEARYNETVDPIRLHKVVHALSRPNTDHNSYSPEVVSWPFGPDDLTHCGCGVASEEFGMKWYYLQYVRSEDMVTIKAQIRKTCLDPPKIVESKCNYVRKYFTQCGRFTMRSSQYDCDYGDRKSRNCPDAYVRCVENLGSSQGQWVSFVGPLADLQQWRGKLNRDRCPAVVASVNSSIWEGAYSLAEDLKVELADVKDIIGTLRKIVAMRGMPQASFGVLRSVYPLLGGKCDPGNRNVTTLGSSRGIAGSRGSWRGRRCPPNCKRCQPSWRCLQCATGYRKALDGLWCVKA